MELASLIYTYARIDDTRVNMDIIRHEWPKHGLDKTAIVHAYNGLPEWYERPYLEDELVRLDNPGHFQGASDLIDAGMATIQDKYPDIPYTIVLAADTWLIDPGYIKRVLEEMQQKQLRFATCAWSYRDKTNILKTGCAVDFFIVDNQWAKEFKVFPLDYAGFDRAYGQLLLYQGGMPVFLEKLLLAKFLDASFREDRLGTSRELSALKKIYRFTEREPVHPVKEDGISKRLGYIASMGLLGHHAPEPKRTILRQRGINQGEAVQKLLGSDDLAYYNRGLRDGYPYQVIENIE